MKIVNVLVFLFLSSFLLTSCQKELDFGNFESAGTLNADAISHDCYPSSVHGTYLVNTALGDTNYIEVQINTTLSGNYSIQTDSSNGYSFKGEGSFTGTGTNTVRLYGHGTPSLPGTNSFIVHYNSIDSSSCIIDVTVLAGAGVSAQYTFAGAGGTCTGGGHGGLYMAGIATTSSNTDTVSVNVTLLGNYSITTTSVNGISFSASGAFTTLGIQNVILIASGTPAAQGAFDFPLSGASQGCAFSITFDPLAAPATFVLGGNPGSCTGAVLSGTYEATTATTSSNTLLVDVNVSAGGSYSITTNTQNGVSFSASGLITTGTTQIVLYASGTPLASGTFNYNIQVSSSTTTCTFSVPFTAAPSNYFTCSFDGGATTSTFNDNLSAAITTSTQGFPILTFGGSNTTTNQDFSIEIQTATAVTSNTDYNVNMAASAVYLTAVYTDPAAVDWSAITDIVNTQTPAFTVHITTITPGVRVTGTFSGPVKEAAPGTNVKTITTGAFSIPL